MKKIFYIVGTRPEAIKVAPVILESLKHKDKIETIILSTGQHKEMLQQVMDIFSLHPNIELNLMKESQTLSSLTADLFKSFDQEVIKHKPDWIVAQGDTTSVMVASIIAYYHKIKFAHIEAGLRTGDLYRPFPEELNRIIADLVADLMLAPTKRNKDTLLKTVVKKDCKIEVVGNTVIDAINIVKDISFEWNESKLSDIDLDKKIILITAHRRESFGDDFNDMIKAIKFLAQKHKNIQFVFPVHLNPNVKKPVFDNLLDVKNIYLLKPLDYLTMVQIMSKADLVLTDSGGIQEEVPTFGTPLLVMRSETERQEGIEAGVAKLVGTDAKVIIREVENVISSGFKKHKITNPYGDGKSSERIVDLLINS